MKNRYAFTMIELIFVIIIIGILAAVAIPKIMATRDDAKVATTSQSISVAATEVASFAISQGRIEKELSLMSNAIAMMKNRGEATTDPRPNESGGAAYFKMGETDDCLQFLVIDGVLDANLTLGYGISNNDALCDNLQMVFDATRYPIPLRGPRVKEYTGG